jgi:hypothetical protein
MSETHEEQRLADLLNEIAGEDVSIEAPREIEHRVMAYWDARGRHRNNRSTYWVAAALAAGLLVALALPRSQGRAPKPLGLSSPPVSEAISPPPVPAIERAATPRETDPGPAEAAALEPSRAPRATPRVAGAFSGAGKRRIDAAITEPRREVLNFVPLVPFAEQEPIGSFQLVRIRLSRTALRDFGVAWDLNQEADSVQADVLLGEDGLARAIRVTSDSTGDYLWRSR